MTETYISDQFYLSPPKLDEVDAAIALCNACVGDGMYCAEEIKKSIDAEDSFFYLLKTEAGEIAGYLYFYITDLAQIALDGKFPADLVEQPQQKPVGKIQSIGIKNKYRGEGLSTKMIRFAMRRLQAVGMERVFIICWKKGVEVPLRPTLSQCGFQFLCVAKKVWYDHPRLRCPYCGGRCCCDAEIYYRILNEGAY